MSSSVPEFDLLAASLRADAGDLRAFVEALAAKLTGSFPERVKVERKGRLLGGDKRVRRLAVTLGDHVYELRERRRPCRLPAADTRARDRPEDRGDAARGWIDELSRRLLDEAGKSESDRAALARMLEA